MFISKTNLTVGDVVRLFRDIQTLKGTITNGSKVIITEITERGYSIIDIESGERASECGFMLGELSYILEKKHENT
jgi:hypothetical protein